MLPRELLKKLRRIEILTARAANNQLAGAYHSVFKGIGVVFSEVRQYQPGDDVRRIDWNVTARMDEAYVKLFIEEREMTVMLLVDASGSGLFGTREQSKRDVAAEVAALLAFSAIKNNDRVGLVIFTDRVEKYVPPKKGKKHVLRVITEILTYQPASRGTDLRVALEFLGKVARKRSVSFLVSDFLTPQGGYERALRVTNNKHDIVPVTLTDPMEEELPRLGFVSFEDVETGSIVEFDTLGRDARAYARRVRVAKVEREALFRRLKMDSINVRTDAPYLGPLIQFFRNRERRMSH